jgi:hypothetical protein
MRGACAEAGSKGVEQLPRISGIFPTRHRA